MTCNNINPSGTNTYKKHRERGVIVNQAHDELRLSCPPRSCPGAPIGRRSSGPARNDLSRQVLPSGSGSVSDLNEAAGAADASRAILRHVMPRRNASNCGSRTCSFSKYRKTNSLQMGEKIEFP